MGERKNKGNKMTEKTEFENYPPMYKRMDIDREKNQVKILDKIYDLFSKSSRSFNEYEDWALSFSSIIADILVELKKIEPLRTDRLLYNILGTLEEVYYKENK